MSSSLSLHLATSSPRKLRLFQQHFPSPTLTHSDHTSDEKSIRDDDPDQLVQKVAAAKVAEALKAADAVDVVVATDLVVVWDGKVREKPKDEDEAKAFLRDYQRAAKDKKKAWTVQAAAVHHVPTGKKSVRTDKGWVTFKAFDDAVIDKYVKEGNAMQCAGGFDNCSDIFGKYIDEVGGTQDAAVGFPVKAVREMLLELCPEAEASLAPPTIHLKDKPIKAIIFDMDGLLLDTESFYTVVAQKILDRFGLQFTWEIKSRMMGRKALDASRIMIEHYGIGDKYTAEEFVKEREESLDKLFPHSELLPGVERLLLHLHAKGIPMSIATGSHKRHFALKTEKHRDLFEKVFGHIVTSDEVKEAKPNPEIFNRALEQFKVKVDPSETLVFEDAPLGVNAGLNAGMSVVMVNQKREPGEDLKPTQYLTSMYEFYPEQWGLPKFEEE